MNNYTEIMSIIDRQEHMLRIDRFTSDFALEFGCMLVERAKERALHWAFRSARSTGPFSSSI